MVAALIGITDSSQTPADHAGRQKELAQIRLRAAASACLHVARTILDRHAERSLKLGKSRVSALGRKKYVQVRDDRLS
jgi:cob(I)alamin adenosyltransferase